MSLDGKSALVLGGVGGIGKAVIDHLLAAGLQRLAVIDITEETQAREALGDLLSRSSHVQFVYAKSPVDDEPKLREAMTTVAEELKGLDIVINSAGIFNENDPKGTIMINFVSP